MNALKLDLRFMSFAFDDVGSGLPVVLLHAFPFDRTMWKPQLGPLSAAGFRLLVPDLPEFGDTTPGTEVFTIEGGADVIAEFLEAINVEKAVVVGLSMGGYVAMAFAPTSGDACGSDSRRYQGCTGRRGSESQARSTHRRCQGGWSGRGRGSAVAEAIQPENV